MEDVRISISITTREKSRFEGKRDGTRQTTLKIAAAWALVPSTFQETKFRIHYYFPFEIKTTYFY